MTNTKLLILKALNTATIRDENLESLILANHVSDEVMSSLAEKTESWAKHKKFVALLEHKGEGETTTFIGNYGSVSCHDAHAVEMAASIMAAAAWTSEEINKGKVVATNDEFNYLNDLYHGMRSLKLGSDERNKAFLTSNVSTTSSFLIPKLNECIHTIIQ